MSKKNIGILYKDIENTILNKEFLNNIGINKKTIVYLLKKHKVKEKLTNVLTLGNILCRDVLQCLKEMMEDIKSEPEPNWLNYITEYLVTDIYPEKESFIGSKSKEEYKSCVFLYLEVLRKCLEYDNVQNPKWEGKELKFIRKNNLGKSYYKEEYQRLKEITKEFYIYEMMKISREINPFDTLSHISGVHYIATHCGKQLQKIGKEVDLALVSGAAITHDIGKFGCNKKEISRIPYLHYYYTDQFCKRWGLNQISHIASNHSTWDLELENLSVESLLLIYSDFRVKSTWEDGVENVHFYSLEESFNVILSKLDNVDEAKERRYKKVYSKLQDFEKYMISLGVNVDLTTSVIVEKDMDDVNLLQGIDVVNRLKFLAIDHNIRVMNQFNIESNFASILEAARGERDWKNLRSYLNIIKEYHTYMTKKQKQMTLKFTYELLQNREGDIRRDAAYLMGMIVSTFDEEYRKELPEGVVLKMDSANKFTVWNTYLNKIVNPDYSSTIQQKRWIGYTLRIFIRTVLANSSEEDRGSFIKIFLKFLNKKEYDDLTAFVLIEAINYLPLRLCHEDEIAQVEKFIFKADKRENLEIQVALYNITEGRLGKLPDYKNNSEIFRDNLKFDTPWILKINNIGLLVKKVNEKDKETSILQVGTHFANLLKVGDKVTVRHSAGKGLVEIIERLSADERNELAIELTKGLEIGEYEYSKYIPEYLGKVAVTLEKNDFNALLSEIRRLIGSRNEKVASVAVDTAGYILKEYQLQVLGALDSTGNKGINQTRNSIKNTKLDEEMKVQEKEKIMAMLLLGLGDYRDDVSKEAFIVIGQHIFGDKSITLDIKFEYFKYFYKKILTLISERRESTLVFYNNASGLNHIYRFISDYLHIYGNMNLDINHKMAFFPGTFDPFSKGHKEIARKIRDMGFEVYLAIDEFSWSKRTQPHKVRRKIAMMSIADEKNVYLFPENIPVNIANPKSIRQLKDTLKNENVYLAVGSDVIENASSYKKLEEEDSVHSLNHIVFKRVDGEKSEKERDFGTNEAERREGGLTERLKGDIILLSLPSKFNSISSTKIRESIDTSRDISYLVDKNVQDYIYDKGLYMREPQYKTMAEIEDLRVGNFRKRKGSFLSNIKSFGNKLTAKDMAELKKYMEDEKVKSVVVRSGKGKDNVIAMAIAKEVSTSNLYDELKDFEITRKIRSEVRGKILFVGHIFVTDKKDYGDLYGIILTELLAAAMKDEFTYCIYSPILENAKEEKEDKDLKNTLERYGFSYINNLPAYSNLDLDIDHEKSLMKYKKIMAVDMKNPVVLIQNTDSFLKAPFNKNPKLKKILGKTHIKLQESLKNMYPENLILTVNSGLMQNKMIKLIRNKNKENLKDKVTLENAVKEQGFVSKGLQHKQLGENMAVPFGQIMKNTVIPETVTKAIHMEKVFDSTVTTYNVIETKNYSKILNQVRTIVAFERPIILIDDILHKGYRIQRLNPVLRREGVKVNSIIAGVLSANGRDIVKSGGRTAESAYFLPNLQAWFNESGQYPYIGGDAVIDRKSDDINYGSINLVLPYAAPLFLKNKNKKAFYQFSMTCLLNGRDIFLEIEKIYQEIFERKLTLNRLSEVFTKVSIPDEVLDDKFDDGKSPSDYIKEDIDKLHRLKGLI